MQLKYLAYGIVLPITRVSLLTLANLIKLLPYRHSQSYFSETVNLTDNINHHIAYTCFSFFSILLSLEMEFMILCDKVLCY